MEIATVNSSSARRVEGKSPPRSSRFGVCLVDIKRYSILLIRQQPYAQSTGKYGLPKGHREDPETEWDCAIRELKEETGIDLEEVPFSMLWESNGFFVLSASLECYQLRPDKREVASVFWMPVEGLGAWINRENTNINNVSRNFLVRNLGQLRRIFHLKSRRRLKRYKLKPEL